MNRGGNIVADRQALINGLNQDLSMELGAAILYLFQTSTATGWEAEELREFLKDGINGEMGHAEQIERILKGFGSFASQSQ